MELEYSKILKEYALQVKLTDRFRDEDIIPIVLGLYGEVGGVMAAAKKHRRENDAFVGYRVAVEEEFGDALWYFAALCRRLNLSLDNIFADIFRQLVIKFPEESNSKIACIDTLPNLENALLALGHTTSQLLTLTDYSHEHEKLNAFAICYMDALRAAGLKLSEIIEKNIKKVCGRFLKPALSSLPTFNAGFTEDEQLPKHFEIEIVQRKSGRSYLKWNGVFIGDPLTDNIANSDGYRFHDIFHMAHAAILHWSPVFRALIKHKRKSDSKIDEAQDSGRPIVVEEGLTAFVFSRAKELDFFKGQKTISFDLLKTIQQFVEGYEVSICPLSLWEDAILQGYEVFRQVKDNNGGIVIGDRDRRIIKYRPL